MPNWIGLTQPDGTGAIVDAEQIFIIAPAALPQDQVMASRPKSVVYVGPHAIVVMENPGEVAHLAGIDMKTVKIIVPKDDPGEPKSNDKRFLRVQH